MKHCRAKRILRLQAIFWMRKRVLIGPDGMPVNISSRAFDTLHYLASHPHELIDKHRLMKAVWPNSVVEENNLNQQISTLRKVLGEAAGDHRYAGSRFIVTVSGRGYRFVQDVQRVGSLPVAAEGLRESPAQAAGNGSADDSPARSVPDAAARRGWRSSWPGAMVAAVVVLMVGAAYVLLAGPEWGRTVPMEAPSIAVLPFADVSPNHDQGYFADGLSEELLNALGRLNGLRVIGRTSSFSFKGRNEDVRQVAATLGVQHVLEGSVRRDGDRLRITTQLVMPRMAHSSGRRRTIAGWGMSVRYRSRSPIQSLPLCGSHSGQRALPRWQEERAISRLTRRTYRPAP
jgi:TolB-like protein/DNA-binding winged helix-turn-helix (wHTH) protein